jgi:hypothetical protein
MASRGACGAAFSAFAAIGQLLGQVGQRLIPVPTPASFNNLGMQGGAFKLQDRGIIRLNIQNYQLLQPQYCYLSCYTIAHLVTRTDTSGYWIFKQITHIDILLLIKVPLTFSDWHIPGKGPLLNRLLPLALTTLTPRFPLNLQCE